MTGALNPGLISGNVVGSVAQPQKQEVRVHRALPLIKLRLAVAPKIGRIYTQAHRRLDAVLSSGIVALEKLAATKQGSGGESKLQAQRQKAIKTLGVVSKVTDLGILASAIASMIVAPAQWATLGLGMATLVLRKAQRVIGKLALQTHLQQQGQQGPLSPAWCLTAVSLMRLSGEKFLPTRMGLASATDLALYAHQMLKSIEKRDNPNIPKEQVLALKARAEDTLRRILAGKINRRDILAQVRLRDPIASDERVSANYVHGSSFGKVGDLIPLESSKGESTKSVVSLLTGQHYGTQSCLPGLGYTLRNIQLGKSHDSQDWVNLIQHRKHHNIELSDKDERILAGAEVAKERAQALLLQPLADVVLEGLAHITDSDATAFKCGDYQSMSKAGTALVYAAQDLVRRNFADCGLSSAAEVGSLGEKALKAAVKRLPALGSVNTL